MKASPSFEELVDMYNQVDEVLATNWISVKDNDYRKALNALIDFNIQIATDPKVSGCVLFTLEERKILNKLVGDFWVGPAARPVLAKLKEGLEE